MPSATYYAIVDARMAQIWSHMSEHRNEITTLNGHLHQFEEQVNRDVLTLQHRISGLETQMNAFGTKVDAIMVMLERIGMP